MTRFEWRLAFNRVLANVHSTNPETERYLDGYRFGLGAAEEVGQFEPSPEFPPPLLDDLFLMGAFDGRSGLSLPLLCRLRPALLTGLYVDARTTGRSS